MVKPETITTLGQHVAAVLDDFRKVAALADAEFIAESIAPEFLAKPHRPGGLPAGKMAVYALFLDARHSRSAKLAPIAMRGTGLSTTIPRARGAILRDRFSRTRQR